MKEEKDKTERKLKEINLLVEQKETEISVLKERNQENDFFAKEKVPVFSSINLKKGFILMVSFS